jgi:hypothetical protein
MAENMMCSAHKASTEKFRDGWDRIFNKQETKPEGEDRGRTDSDGQ